MRFSTIVFLMLVVLIPGGALAAGEGFYVGGHFGLGALDDTENTSSEGSFEFDSQEGFVAGGVVGFNFGKAFPGIGTGRVELEVSHRKNELDTVGFSEGTFDAGGDFQVTSVMVNSFAEYRIAPPLLVYFGGGIGVARVALQDATVLDSPLADDDDEVFAYQGGAGVGFQATERLVLDLGYRYFATSDPEFTDVRGDDFDSEYQNHSVLLTARLKVF